MPEHHIQAKAADRANGSVDPAIMQDPYWRPHWYAILTFTRHEKSVAKQLKQRNLDHYLPLSSSRHRWKDRWAVVEQPLFPGYVFARFAWPERLRALTVPGVLRIVCFDGLPAIVDDSEVESLQRSLSKCKAVPCRYFSAGRRVRVNSGSLAGLEGIVVRRKGSQRLVVSIAAIRQSFAVELDTGDVEPVGTPGQVC
jgi:transcription antitermination factor NusG